MISLDLAFNVFICIGFLHTNWGGYKFYSPLEPNHKTMSGTTWPFLPNKNNHQIYKYGCSLAADDSFK